ncbi:hypothetical protein D3C76_1466580 [compost metagenome]
MAYRISGRMIASIISIPYKMDRESMRAQKHTRTRKLRITSCGPVSGLTKRSVMSTKDRSVISPATHQSEANRIISGIISHFGRAVSRIS